MRRPCAYFERSPFAFSSASICGRAPCTSTSRISERGEQVDVVHEAREARALGDHLAAEGDDEGAAAEVVHVGRDLAEPADEGFGLLQLAIV